MSEKNHTNTLADRGARGATLLALGLVAAGALLALGAWALAGSLTADSASTPTLTDAYGTQFLLTERQVADQARAAQARPETNDNPAVSPLKNWSYTARKISPSR